MDRDTKMHQLRDHYDNVDTSADMEDGHWESETDQDPMVTTSLRLPKSLLDWVRQQAETERVRPTALIRHWIEERRVGADSMAERLTRLEAAVFHGQGWSVPGPGQGAHDSLGTDQEIKR